MAREAPKITWPIFLALSLLCAGIPRNHFAADRPSRLVQARGTVEFQDPKTGSWKNAKRGQVVQPGSQIRTGPSSWAQINTNTNDRLQLSPKTVVSVQETSSLQTSVKVLLGRLRSIVKRIKSKRKFRVLTPMAVASVRGTEFDTIVEEDGRSTFEVYEGILSVKDLANIGAEVSLFKNQRTTVEPGAAPLPPEIIPEGSRGEFRDRREKTKQLARLEAKREIALQEFREQLQADVAREQRLAEYEDGKTVIDAFGMRVRVEEYIVRPDPKQFSFVTINTRDNNISLSRYDAFAKENLPRRLDDINFLFRQTDPSGSNAPLNWIERQKWFLSNGGDFYREWSEGGTMVFFPPPDGGFWRVVFGHWYVELKGRAADNFNLVSHWTPHPNFLDGSQTSTTSENLLTDGVLDIPDGYVDYENPGDVETTVGDTRPIDSPDISYTARLQNSNIFENPEYQTSEGYVRTSHAELDGVGFSTLPDNQAKAIALLNAKVTSAVHSYTLNGNSVTSLRVDEYKIDDLGTPLSLADRLNRGVGLDSINFEQVAHSPDYSSKIDLVLSPRIFIKAGLLSGD